MEFFTELLAGRIVKLLKGFLPQQHRGSLICADAVKGGDSWGLIQPKQNMTELYGLIGTGQSWGGKSGDRSAATETFLGRSRYK